MRIARHAAECDSRRFPECKENRAESDQDGYGRLLASEEEIGDVEGILKEVQNRCNGEKGRFSNESRSAPVASSSWCSVAISLLGCLMTVRRTLSAGEAVEAQKSVLAVNEVYSLVQRVRRPEIMQIAP